MTLQHGMPQGFVKHVVRRADIVARAAANVTQSTTATPKASSQIARTQTSSLEAPVVAILLGGFLGVFLIFVLIGVTCKFANRPRADQRPQADSKAMFQPSAAGYGSAAASYGRNQSMQDVSSPSIGLLGSAQPMGRGGQYEEAADSSLGSSNGLHGNNRAHGGFGMIPSHSAGSFSGDEADRFAASRGGHARGNSSGIELPNPAASSAFRRNVSGSHPPVHSPGTESYDLPHSATAFAPDGSGFTPGQIFDHNAITGGAPKTSAEMREARTSYLGAAPSVMPRRASLVQTNANPQARPYPRGPPPSSSKNRRSKYANPQLQSSNDSQATRRSRIDSVGPGTYRKSMFLPQESDSMPSGDYAGGAAVSRSVSNGKSGALRRVESIGKGDPRTASRYQHNNRISKVPNIMMTEEEEYARGGFLDGMPSMGGNSLMPSNNGWDDGRHSPYGSSNGSSSPLGPLAPHDPMLSMQQQQEQHGGGVRMMPYGAGFGAPMPRPGMATTQVSSSSSFAPAAPLGAGLGTRQIL